MQRRRKHRRGSAASHTMLSLLRKDLREGNLQALLGGSSYMAPPPAAAPDPFISSLIYTLPLDEPSKDAQPESFDEGSLVSKSSDKEVVERYDVFSLSFTLHGAYLIFIWCWNITHRLVFFAIPTCFASIILFLCFPFEQYGMTTLKFKPCSSNLWRLWFDKMNQLILLVQEETEGRHKRIS